MSYLRQTWALGSAGGTKMNPTRLNYMEAGIEDAAETAAWARLTGVPAFLAAGTTAALARQSIGAGTSSVATADDLPETATRKWLTVTERSKLAGIADGATVNATDAALRARSSHTGVQDISTITNLQTLLDGKLAAGERSITPTVEPEYTRYNNGSQATMHLTSMTGFSAPYLLGIGNDKGSSYGLLVSNKDAGVGAVFNNTDTVTAADGYALRVTNASTVSPGALFELISATAGAALKVTSNTAASIASRRLSQWAGAPGGAYTVYGEIWGDGTFNWQGSARLRGSIGFFTTAPQAQKTITGSRGGNAALASLLTQLAGYGLIVDSTSA